MSKPILQEESQKGFSNQKPPSESLGDHIHSIKDPPTIRDVWENNFEEEFRIIMNLAEKYRVIGMDTEFPGIVARLTENDLAQLSSVNEIEYQTIKLNTDKLKVIQVGISFASEDGYLPEKVPSWQFNFKFDLQKDEYANDAIKLLTNSGLKFEKHATQGINPQLFAEYLIGSGLLFNEDIKWVSFHGGFDFAYLIKMLNGQNLPDDEVGFYNLLNIYFPTFYDVKCMVKDIDTLKRGSLNKIASDLNVRRIGPQHQAGSDSLLTLATYFQLKKSYFTTYSETRYANVLYGVGSTVEEELDDYVWQNFLGPDFSPVMFNHGYGMPNGSMMDQYHVQPEYTYGGGHYGMTYGATYPGSYMTPYMETGSKFYNKYDMEIGKAKN